MRERRDDHKAERQLHQQRLAPGCLLLGLDSGCKRPQSVGVDQARRTCSERAWRGKQHRLWRRSSRRQRVITLEILPVMRMVASLDAAKNAFS